MWNLGLVVNVIFVVLTQFDRPWLYVFAFSLLVCDRRSTPWGVVQSVPAAGFGIVSALVCSVEFGLMLLFLGEFLNLNYLLGEEVLYLV